MTISAAVDRQNETVKPYSVRYEHTASVLCKENGDKSRHLAEVAMFWNSKFALQTVFSMRMMAHQPALLWWKVKLMLCATHLHLGEIYSSSVMKFYFGAI